MKKINISLVHLLIAISTFLFCTAKLTGQERPEMIPYILSPNDYHPDSNLELGITIIHPYSLNSIPIDIQREETLEMIYERIAFEVVNPQHKNEIFSIDGKLYHLVRVPYTGASWDFDREWLN